MPTRGVYMPKPLDWTEKDVQRFVDQALAPQVRHALEEFQPRPRLSFAMQIGATKMSEPAVSPTGAAVVPQNVVRIAAALVGVAGVLLQALPEHTIAFKICSLVVSIGAAAGIVSQGVRK